MGFLHYSTTTLAGLQIAAITRSADSGFDVTGKVFAFDYTIEGNFTNLQDKFKGKKYQRWEMSISDTTLATPAR